MTSHHVSTWEMCNTLPPDLLITSVLGRGAEREDASARRVGFPRAIRRGWEISPAVSAACRAPAICPPTDLLAAKQPAFA